MAQSCTEDIFGSYSIASHDPLVGLKRSKCKKCKGSRMFFCYRCHIYMDGVDVKKMPSVKLPYKIDIIKHAKEVDGKSTAIHAALLSPEDVRIYTYPSIPDYTNESGILLIFPDKKASTMEDVFGDPLNTEKELENGEGDEAPNKKRKLETAEARNGDNGTVEDMRPVFKKIVFIDCTWNQAYGIFTDERISHLPTVKLNNYKTVYWRHNEEMPFTFLATIEAIYYFLKHSHSLMHGTYEGQYDNLLYFYSYFYKLVQNGKDRGSKK